MMGDTIDQSISTTNPFQALLQSPEAIQQARNQSAAQLQQAAAPTDIDPQHAFVALLSGLIPTAIGGLLGGKIGLAAGATGGEQGTRMLVNQAAADAQRKDQIAQLMGIQSGQQAQEMQKQNTQVGLADANSQEAMLRQNAMQAAENARQDKQIGSQYGLEGVREKAADALQQKRLDAEGDDEDTPISDADRPNYDAALGRKTTADDTQESVGLTPAQAAAAAGKGAIAKGKEDEKAAQAQADAEVDGLIRIPGPDGKPKAISAQRARADAKAVEDVAPAFQVVLDNAQRIKDVLQKYPAGTLNSITDFTGDDANVIQRAYVGMILNARRVYKLPSRITDQTLALEGSATGASSPDDVFGALKKYVLNRGGVPALDGYMKDIAQAGSEELAVHGYVPDFSDPNFLTHLDSFPVTTRQRFLKYRDAGSSPGPQATAAGIPAVGGDNPLGPEFVASHPPNSTTTMPPPGLSREQFMEWWKNNNP